MKTLSIIILPLLLILAACSSKAEPTDVDNNTNATDTTAPVVDVAVGAKFFMNTCTPCHGATGRGDGAASASLDPKPRDFSDSAWQTSIDDEYLSNVIK